MSVQTVSKVTATQRRPQVAEMYIAGKYQTDIARHFGVTPTTIHNDLKAIRRQWAKEYAETWNDVVIEQLAKIDKQEREAWQAWERSKLDAETKETFTESSGKTQDGKPIVGKTTLKKKSVGQAGDPRFLQSIQWCIEQRLKVVGGYASDRRAKRKLDNEEKWVTELVDAIKNGRLNYEQVKELFPDLVDTFFAKAGVSV